MRRPFTSLYVHVPFCAARCGYCAFYSVAQPSAHLRATYLERLGEELESASHECATLQSIYVGGGTPSFLTEQELGRLLSTVREGVTLGPGAEFSLECNPESLTEAKAGILAEYGVNRAPLGVQSFEPRLRAVLRRRGSPADVEPAVDALRRHGIVNVGLDLIYVVAGQSMADWQADLRRALKLEPEHVSTYELTVEEGTELARTGAKPVQEEQAVAMWHLAAEVLAAGGIRRYEVSNLARARRACRHHMRFWHGRTYLGIGPAAVSFNGETHSTNPSDLPAWLGGEPPTEERLCPRLLAAEMLGLGLRTVRGWQREEFQHVTGKDYQEGWGETLGELTAGGLLKLSAEAVCPTARGLLLADYVAARLVDSAKG